MFWRPMHVRNSAWLHHVPFAFWLVEALRPRVCVEVGVDEGVSYFALCQAVERLGLETRCYAVDAWDDDGGGAAPVGFAALQAYNESHYGAFSRLLRGEAATAPAHFGPSSIDLLHLNGTLATAEDFATWIPKLSERAIVVVHGTEAAESTSDAPAVYASLQQRYPSFEFMQGDGLGVLAVGSDPGVPARQLFDIRGNESMRQSLQEVFTRLGRACADHVAAQAQHQRAADLQHEVTRQGKHIEEIKQGLDKAKADLGSRGKELAEARTRLQTQSEQHAVERGQLAERIHLLQEIRAELKEEIARLHVRIDSMQAESARRADEAISLAVEAGAHKARAASQDRALASCEAEVSRTRELLELARGELVDARRDAQRSAQEAAARQQALEGTQSNLADARRDLQRLVHEAALRDETHGNEVAALRHDLQAGAAQAARREAEQEAEIGRGEEALQRCEVLREALAAHNHELERCVAEAARRIEALEADIGHHQAALQRLEADRAAHAAGEHERDAELAALRSDAMERIEELRRLREVCSRSESQTAARMAEVTELTAKVSKLDEQSKLRFAEIAKLTTLADRLQQQASEADRHHAEARRSLNDAIQAGAERERQHVSRNEELRLESERQIKAIRDLTDERGVTAALVRSAHDETEALKVRVARQAAEIEALKGSQEQARVAAQARFAEIATLTGMTNRLERERDVIGRELDDARRAIADARARAETEASRVRRLKKTISWRITTPLRSVAGLFGKSASLPQLRASIKALRDSGLFDEAWYLERYRDVKASGMNPAEHYLRFGAGEGRNPGPSFNTVAYLARYPDVASSKLNAALHYARHGRAKGRIAIPAHN
jgi:hypothetical protein